MKKLLLIACSLFLLGKTNAQTPTPYYSGFDNAGEQAGWQTFRTGYTSPYPWVMGANPYAPSSPNSYGHDYPVGGAPTAVIDWAVSPVFDFTGGGQITSFKAFVYSITGLTTPDDHFGVYLIKGSPNPSTGTVTMLRDLTNLVTSGTTWSDISTINIPPTSGNSYIAFKYMGKSSWFTTNFDNVRIDANPPCSKVGTITATPLTTSATLSWATVSGNSGYEYVSDMIIGDPPSSSTVTPTGSTSVNITGLNANSTYYMHVRTVCGPGVYSNWTNQAFFTKEVPPACTQPADVVIDNLTTNSVSFNWPAVKYNDGYEFIVKEGATAPGNSGQTTMLNHASVSGLKTGYPYFIFVRTRCEGEASRVFSAWYAKEFFVPFPTGINEVETSGVRVYPNPVSDILNIDIEQNETVIVTIKNIAGKTVNHFNSTGTIKADLSALPAGMYFAEITTAQQHKTVSVIKQ